MHKERDWKTPLANIIFWGYNGLYSLYVFIFLISLTSASVRTSINQIFKSGNLFTALFLLFLLSYPLLSIYYVLKSKIYKNASSLWRFFFIVEIPLVTITFFSLSMVTQPIPAVGFGIVLLLLIPLTVYLNLLQDQANALQRARIFLTGISLAAAVYASLILSFFIPVMIVELVQMPGFLHYSYMNSIADIMSMLFGLTFAGLGILIGAIVVFSPFAAVYFLAKKLFSKPFTAHPSFKKLTISAAAFFITLFAVLSIQPAAETYLTKLSSFSKASAFEEKESLAKELVQHEQGIETQLKDVQGAYGRYLFRAEDRFLERAYELTFGMENLGAFVQDVFNVLVAPFVYQGPTDYSSKLSKAFYDLFGRYPNTYNYQSWTSTQAGPANVEVFRTIKAKTDKTNLAAAITIEEQYQNKTYQNQEVIYEFSFPTDVVITDLKLGADLEFSAVVAPRGASKTVYEREVTRSRDPALLEQTGPRQYKLRVFPIPGLNDTTLGGKPQRVQFSYTATALKSGFPLPVYSFTSNVKLPVSQSVYRDMEFIPHQQAVNLCQALTAADNIDLAEPTISAKLIPYGASQTCQENGILAVQSLNNANVAILFDVSYDARNTQQAKEFSKLLASYPNLLSQNSIDLYKFNTLVSKAQPLKSVNDFAITYFGRSDLVKAILSLRNANYDAVIVVSGNSQMETSADKLSLPAQRVYLVNAKNALTQELTQYILSSGGSAAESIEEAFNSLTLSTIFPDRSFISPYFTILVEPQELSSLKITTDDPFSHLTAYSLLVREMAKEKAGLANVVVLDKLHEFARLNRFATPYSSFIALVNEAQMRQLEEESKRYDRYREQGLSPIISPIRPMMPIMPMDVTQREMSIPAFGAPAQLKGMPSISGGMGGGGGDVFMGPPAGALTGLDSFGGLGFVLMPLFLINLLLVGIGALVLMVVGLKKKLKKKIKSHKLF